MPRRPNARTGTIRGMLFALIAVVTVPLAALGVYEVLTEYRDAREAEVRASAELARTLANGFEAFVADLARTEYAIAVSVAVHEHTLAEIEDELVAVRGEYPAVRDMSWAREDGTILASTEPALVGKSIAGREYMHEIRAGAASRVSSLVHSLVDGAPVFVVARAFRTDSGALRGIVVAAVDVDTLALTLEERSGKGIISVIDSTGALVASRPTAPSGWEARRAMRDHWGVQRALAGGEALGLFKWQGEEHVGAFVPIPALGWVAHASRPHAEAIAEARRRALWTGAAGLALLALALGGALALARRIAGPLRALERHATALAHGEPGVVRVDAPAEIQRVARAFTWMAARLAARRAELQELNRQLSEREAQAQAHGAALEAVIAALPVGVVILAPDQKPLRVNEPARQILGDGEPAARFRAAGPSGEPLPEEAQPQARALRGELVRGELLRFTRDRGGGTAWLSVSAAPIRDAGGAVQGAVVTVEDLTELRELQEERETLMQMVSHDLRTPLNVVVGHARLLRGHADEAVRRRAEAVLGSAARMTRLIGDLVDAAILEAGHLALRLEPVDLPAFLSEWKERTSGALADARVRLALPDAAPIVVADPDRLEQILANLVSNALKYSAPDTPVKVELRSTPGALVLAVRDRGPGIAPEDLPHLFDRYYRAKSTTRADGLGLGLFITRKLVAAHGWRLDVESELGVGSVFKVTVPTPGPVARSTAAA